MRKTNPQIRWHLTPEEKKQIRALTRAGVRQSEIALRLGITAPSVSKVQRAAGLPTKLVTPEKQIMELFKKGVGGYTISRRLRCPANRVWAVAHKHGFRRADGVGYPLSRELREKIIEAIRAHDDHATQIAEKFGVTAESVLRLAHRELRCPEFRSGRSKPPLSSNYPQRTYRKRAAQ
jgi:transposase-like protein